MLFGDEKYKPCLNTCLLRKLEAAMLLTTWLMMIATACAHAAYLHPHTPNKSSQILTTLDWKLNSQSGFHFNDLTLWTWCLAPPLQFPDTRSSIEIRYGDFFGYLKTAFYSGDFGVCGRHCSLGQNIVCTMSMEFQSPGILLPVCGFKGIVARV